MQDRQVPRVQAWRRQPCPTLLSFAGADVENTFEIPQLQLVDAGLRASPAGSTGAVVEKTVEIPQLQPVDARPRCAGQQVPQVQSARRQSRSHCCCSFMPELQYIDKVVDVPVVVHMPVVVPRQVP